MKAIKITQENIDNNKRLLKGKVAGAILQFTKNNFPKVWNNANVNFNSDLVEFSEVIEPTLSENEKFVPLTEADLIDGVWVQRKKPVTQAELDAIALEKDKTDKKIKASEDKVIVFEGVTSDGLKDFIVTVDNSLNFEVIEIKN